MQKPLNDSNLWHYERNEVELSDLFYTSQKKGFKVKLNQLGFFLQRDGGSGTSKTIQSVQMSDIVGSRCIYRQKITRLGNACSCVATSSSRSVVISDDGSKNTIGACSISNDEDSSAYLYVFAYVLKRNLRNTLRRERKVLTLRFRSFDNFEMNMNEAERWYKMLKWHKYHTLNEPNASLSSATGCRRLLIMLNPKSGSGKARELFHQHVIPVLNESELPYDLHVTKYANYAQEFVSQRNLSSWDGIVAVGGDGLFYEILNGLMQRADWEHILKSTALGIVPCGSGNGLAKSIAHAYEEPYDPKPILGAALTIISGKSTPMDVIRVTLRHETIHSFLSVGWGLISDIDIESERLRSLGYQRFTLWTLHRIIKLRTYRGKIAYLPKTNLNVEELSIKIPKPTLKHSTSCNTYLNKEIDYQCFQSIECLNNTPEFEDVISLETSVNQSFRSRCDSWLSTGSRKSTYYSISESIYHSIADDSEHEVVGIDKQQSSSHESMSRTTTNSSDVNSLIPNNWIVEEGEFVMVHAAYQTHLGIDCFFAPSSKLNDGFIYLVIIRGGISRPQLFNFLINMSSGTHIPSNSEYIKMATVTAFRIEPYGDHGIITVDGERVEFGPLQAEVLPGIAKVMIPK